ncbi:MAG: bifunctional phosphopantothenoylcysteine decarboxylase/phosphopantothenate--cysteine ligase CoaBC [Firmicutes bacterium]|nr:bifunctional phosphopantothenoylcysteine decarboxylase/phosphopantothenate--cysteine ligase CoaBC [Bacillota bacterium]
MILKGKTIAVGISGGIAAYKSCQIVSDLKKLGANVFVVLTKAAQEFVTPLTFETLSQNRVVCDMFDKGRGFDVEHISIAKAADLFLIAPMTANVAGKLASGIADDFLSTTVMACKCPVVLAPAMNTAMLTSASFKANQDTLKQRGFLFVESDEGFLACGDSGKGRMAKPKTIVDFVKSVLLPTQDFKNKKVLVTAGATKEMIDPVRFLSNRSSGKMGVQLARAAAVRGAFVTLVTGCVDDNLLKDLPKIIEVLKVETTCQMHELIKAKSMFDLTKVPNSGFNCPLNGQGGQNALFFDFYFFAAAPCDYRPIYSKNKIKSDSLTLSFSKNPDIAGFVGGQILDNKTHQKSIIFCAESCDLTKNASEKLTKKHAHMVVANDITQEGAGFDIDTNIVTIISKSFSIQTKKQSKADLSHLILDNALKL